MQFMWTNRAVESLVAVSKAEIVAYSSTRACS